MSRELILYGVGRSGTTALYSTIQTMLLSSYNSVDFRYEPFLWDPNVFNKHFRNIKDEFSWMSSLTVKGMYANRVLPLLPTEDPASCISALDRTTTEYLNSICLKANNTDFLFTKTIRANGRAAIFDYLNPNLTSIFIIRNPIDVINSAIEMFSFYGTEFHPSDYERFHEEAITLYGQEAKDCPASNHVEKEAFFWYFSNRAFLEYAQNRPSILCISYDEFLSNKYKTLCDIGDHIGINVPPAIIDEADRRAGPTNSSTRLTHEEFECLKYYHSLFIQLIDTYFPGIKLDYDAAISRHQPNLRDSRDERSHTGRTPLYLARKIRRMEDKRMTGLFSLIRRG